jgi:hypothetical protein
MSHATRLRAEWPKHLYRYTTKQKCTNNFVFNFRYIPPIACQLANLRHSRAAELINGRINGRSTSSRGSLDVNVTRDLTQDNCGAGVDGANTSGRRLCDGPQSHLLLFVLGRTGRRSGWGFRSLAASSPVATTQWELRRLCQHATPRVHARTSQAPGGAFKWPLTLTAFFITHPTNHTFTPSFGLSHHS